MIRLRDEVVHLKTKIAELENFKSESAGYVLHQMEGGIFVYSKQVAVDNEELVVNACPHCYQQKKISMLQPEKRGFKGASWVHFCSSCNSEFTMDKTLAAKNNYT